MNSWGWMQNRLSQWQEKSFEEGPGAGPSKKPAVHEHADEHTTWGPGGG